MLSAFPQEIRTMASPAHNVMHAFRRFVGLRSAWRRSLAMEPRELPRCSKPPPECQASSARPAGRCTAGDCGI